MAAEQIFSHLTTAGEMVRSPELLAQALRAALVAPVEAAGERAVRAVLGWVPRVLRAVSLVLRALVALVVAAWATLVCAVGIYALLYCAVVPEVSLSAPLHFHFDPLRAAPPSAAVPLASLGSLRAGQPYTFHVSLMLPESPDNVAVGMFMTKVSLQGPEGAPLASDARPAVLRYKSGLFRALHTVCYSVPLLLGWIDESQLLAFPVLERFAASSELPVSAVLVELSSPHLQLFSARLDVVADLSRFQSFMYRWFATSATLGISLIYAAEWAFLISLLIFYIVMSYLSTPQQPQPQYQPQHQPQPQHHEHHLLPFQQQTPPLTPVPQTDSQTDSQTDFHTDSVPMSSITISTPLSQQQPLSEPLFQLQPPSQPLSSSSSGSPPRHASLLPSPSASQFPIPASSTSASTTSSPDGLRHRGHQVSDSDDSDD